MGHVSVALFAGPHVEIHMIRFGPIGGSDSALQPPLAAVAACSPRTTEGEREEKGHKGGGGEGEEGEKVVCGAHMSVGPNFVYE